MGTTDDEEQRLKPGPPLVDKAPEATA